MKKLILIVAMLIVLSSVAYSFLLSDSDLLVYLDMEQNSDVMSDKKTNAIGACDFHYDGASAQQTAIAPYGTYSAGINNDFIKNDTCINDKLLEMKNFTACIWVGQIDYSLQKQIFNWNDYTDGGQGWTAIAIDGNFRWGIEINNVIYNLISPGKKGSNYCLRYNGTQYSTFVNGTYLRNVTSALPLYQAMPSTHLSIGNGNSADSVNANIDDMFVINRSLTKTEIQDYASNGATGTTTATTTPTIIFPSPEDSTTNNTVVMLNVSHDTANNDVRYYLYFGTNATLSEGDLIYNNVTRNASEFSQWETNVVNGEYKWKWRVQNTTSGIFSGNTTVRTWTLDSAVPTISFLSNNGFETDNSTFIIGYSSNLTLNISFFDTNLYQTLINITNSTNESVYSIHNVTITGTTANYSRVVDIGSLSVGNYTIYLAGSDTHTISEWGDGVEEKKGIYYIEFDTTEDNVIRFRSNTLPLNKDIISLKDRKSFSFNYLFSQPTYTYHLTSNNKITYLKDSKETISPHFIIGTGIQGNWFDLDEWNLKKDDFKVTKINDYDYEIIVTSNGAKSFTFNSIGGLNIVEEYYQFGITSTVEVWSFDTSTKLSLPFNITFNGVSQSASAGSGVTFTNVTSGGRSAFVSSSGYDSTTVIKEISANYHNFSINLTVNTILDNCTVWNLNTINFTVLNESSDVRVNADADFAFTYNSSNITFVYSTSVVSKNLTQFCLKNDTSISSDVLVSYAYRGTTYEYSTSDLVLNNVTQNINLYTQDGTSQVTFTVTDLFDDEVVGALIQILKYDIGTNTYKTVEILRTNTDGEAVGNLVLSTTWYKFVVINDGVTELLTEPTKIFSTTKVFRLDLTGGDWFGDYDTKIGVNTELNFTNATKNFRYTWVDSSGAMHQGCLEVVKRNRTVENTLYSNCTTSTSATMLYNIGTNVQGNTYIATGYLKFDNEIMTNTLTKTFLGDFFDPLWNRGAEAKEFGVFLSFLLILALTMIGIWNPITAIIMSILGFFIVSMLGFINLGVQGFITIAILGIIVLYKISRN